MTKEAFSSSQYDQAIKMVMGAIVTGDKVTLNLSGSMGKIVYKSSAKEVDGLLIVTITKNGKTISKIVHDNETNNEVDLMQEEETHLCPECGFVDKR